MVMCSDFSLKALIPAWNEELLGPNPFIVIGSFSDSMKLHFNSEKLKECASA
jgi:hypothetical protein